MSTLAETADPDTSTVTVECPHAARSPSAASLATSGVSSSHASFYASDSDSLDDLSQCSTVCGDDFYYPGGDTSSGYDTSIAETTATPSCPVHDGWESEDEAPICVQPGMGVKKSKRHTAGGGGGGGGGDGSGGLNKLANITSCSVIQDVELLEALTGYETQNSYKVYAPSGALLYYMKESSCCCARNCNGKNRSFDMIVTDTNKQQVMRFRRKCKLCTCCLCKKCRGLRMPCCHCCNHEILIEAPPGQQIGRVHEICSCCGTDYVVKNVDDVPMYIVDGPNCCIMACCPSKTFHIKTMAGAKVGAIVKKWSGLTKEVFTDADNFTVEFPKNADVYMKARLLGALILIDFTEFEDSAVDNKQKKPGPTVRGPG